MKLFAAFESLSLHDALIGFEKGDGKGGYYCTPVGMKVLGWDNGIHFGTIRGYGEMIFAVNPENYDEKTGHVYPLASDFRDFLGLLLTAGHTAVIEQVNLMTRERYDSYALESFSFESEKRKKTLDAIQNLLGITPIEDPYAYVTSLQASFDASKLRYTKEYYDSIGAPPPKACKRTKKTDKPADFFSVTTARIARKKEEN